MAKFTVLRLAFGQLVRLNKRIINAKVIPKKRVPREPETPYDRYGKRIRVYSGCLGITCRRRTCYTAKSFDEVYKTVRVGDIRMGKPVGDQTPSSYVVRGMGREPSELKHLSRTRKREDSASSGERKRSSPNQALRRLGL